MTSPPHLHQKHILLTLGGGRSGKTAYAEESALALAGDSRSLYYVATGQAQDDEMATRIKEHQNKRSKLFTTIEEPLNLARVLAEHGQGHVLLIDSFGTWISNHMMGKSDVSRVIKETIKALEESSCSVVVVSEEVGLGIIPDNALSRQFRDHIGELNQAVAGIANRVVFMTAGLPMVIKDDNMKEAKK